MVFGWVYASHYLQHCYVGVFWAWLWRRWFLLNFRLRRPVYWLLGGRATTSSFEESMRRGRNFTHTRINKGGSRAKSVFFFWIPWDLILANRITCIFINYHQSLFPYPSTTLRLYNRGLHVRSCEFPEPVVSASAVLADAGVDVGRADWADWSRGCIADHCISCKVVGQMVNTGWIMKSTYFQIPLCQ